MNKKDKIRVAVIYGGRSPEHEVSVSSANCVMKNLDRNRFEVIPIKIDKEGTWSVEGAADVQLPGSTGNFFNLEWLGRLVDVVFPVMHGTFSEDGTLQGLLELAEVPYIGCGVLASAVCMDKDVARRLARLEGVKVPSYQVVQRRRWNLKRESILTEIQEKFSLPYFVKPANQGSSIGVIKVKDKALLAKAIDQAFHYDTKVLVEEGINARELELGMLESLEDNTPPFVSVIGEVCPHDEFNSYRAKYTEGFAHFVIPPELPKELETLVRTLAQKIFVLLGGEGLARIDFFMDKNTQEVYFNEMNTIPGCTPTSMYPQQMIASGISYSDFLTQLVMLALKRHEEKGQLQRCYAQFAANPILFEV